MSSIVIPGDRVIVQSPLQAIQDLSDEVLNAWENTVLQNGVYLLAVSSQRRVAAIGYKFNSLTEGETL